MALIYSICQRFKTVQFNTKEWFPLKACWISITIVYLRKLVWTDTSNIEEKYRPNEKPFIAAKFKLKINKYSITREMASLQFDCA